jgi:hypothetical protein
MKNTVHVVLKALGLPEEPHLRLEWDRERKHWTLQWQHVFFSDFVWEPMMDGRG